MCTDDSLARAVRLAGGPAAVGRLFGITSQAVSQWERCPPDRVLKLAQASGVGPHELRPDIYPAPPQASTDTSGALHAN
jgi:DNA-binding transcriptional regulator YdaS (Cro superfamily)